MSRIGGINKIMNRLNRDQQKRDWNLIIVKTNKQLPEPDWTKSVKKIDAYMEKICIDVGIDFMKIAGHG